MRLKKQDQDTSRIMKTRAVVVGIIIVAMFVPIVIELMRLQLVDGAMYLADAQRAIARTIPLKGMRGKITDRNGQPLAYDRKSYDVEFYKDPSRTKAADYEEYARTLSEAIDTIEAEGGTVIDNAWLVRNLDGTFAFDFGTTNPDIAAKRETMWRKNFYLTQKKYDDPNECYKALAERYHIPMLADVFDAQLKSGEIKLAEGQSPDDIPTITWEKAHKILSIWQGVQETATLSKPYKIAYDVSFQTVALLESRTDMSGLSVASSSMRVYPRGETVGNIIGYTGKISEGNASTYADMGYSVVDDRIGVAGVESTMEAQLTGNVKYRQGERKVEINSKGKVTREQSITQPTNGNNVMLTIDVKMQEVAYQAMADCIDVINGEKRKFIRDTIPTMKEDDRKRYEEYLAKNDESKYLANMGALVVLDVSNGDVLTSVSFPTYDPSVFVNGITTEQYNEMFVDNPALPLYDKAISTREMPGSIFKMVTGVAGVMEGVISPNSIINCAKEFIPDGVVDSKSFRHCWTNYPSKHQDQNLEAALKNSCNVFFYTVAQRLTIKRLNDWAGRFGLTSKTGIELPNEMQSIVGSEDVLYDPDLKLGEQKTSKPYLAYREVFNYIKGIGQKYNRNYKDDSLDKMTMELLTTARTTGTIEEMHVEVRKILLRETGLTPEQISANSMGNAIINWVRDLRWTSTETVMTGVGQSITRLTPIAVARYIAAIANGGTVYDTHIVERVLRPDGSVENEMEPIVATEVGDIKSVLQIIKSGMKDVALSEDGTASSQFIKSETDPVTGEKVDYAYKDIIGVKTGTAQTNTGKIELENHAWMVGFAPYDKPEIAVVVFIPHGMKGAYASTAFKRVVSYYMERKNSQKADEVPPTYKLVE